MDADSARPGDDLSDVERRLAGWRPAPTGLDADAMLFAAGRAAGRAGRGRLLWPALCGLLAVQAAVLGAWGLSKRAECQALATRLRERAPAAGIPPAPTSAEVPGLAYTPSPDDYYHLLRRMEQDPSRWLAATGTPGPQAPAPPPPGPPIPRAGQRDPLLDP